MAKIVEASPIVFSGNFTGVRIKDEKGKYYKMSVALLMNSLQGAKIIKASPVKRIYRHIEKLGWPEGTK